MSFTTLMQRVGLLKAQPLDGEQLGGKAPAAAPAPATAGDDGAAAAAAVAAAAAAAAAAPVEGQGTADGQDDGGKQGAGTAAEPLVKSMTVQLDGEEYTAFDGEELAKAMNTLHTEHQALRAEAEGTKAELNSALQVVGQAVDLIEEQRATLGTLSKSFTEATATIEAQKSQLAENGELIKSLRTDLDAVRNQGTGRRSVASPAQQSNDLVKSLGDAEGGAQKTMDRSEFMGKCLDLQKTGRMTFEEVVSAETYLNSGMEVPEAIRKKVFSQ